MRAAVLFRNIVSDSVALRRLAIQNQAPVTSHPWTPLPRSFTTSAPRPLPRKEAVPDDDIEPTKPAKKAAKTSTTGKTASNATKTTSAKKTTNKKTKAVKEKEEEEELPKPRRGRPKKADEEGSEPVKGPGRKPRNGPELPTIEEKRIIAKKLGISPADVDIGFPKAPGGRNYLDGTPRAEDAPDERPRAKVMRSRVEEEEEKEEAAKQLKAGRPKSFGPPVPPKRTLVYKGEEVIVSFNPKKAGGFVTMEDLQMKTKREAAREEREETKRMRDEAGVAIPTGRYIVPEGPLTKVAREYLEREQHQEEKQKEWEWVSMDGELEELDPDAPRPHPKAKETDEQDAIKLWDRTVHPVPLRQNPSWRKMYARSVEGSAPTIANMLRADLGDAKSYDKSLVVSEDQCKKLFERFDLSGFEDCTIVDFNPGYGIYSKALNDAVKPKKHILLEPEAVFKPFLDRVCTHESFEFVNKDLYMWSTVDDLIAKGLLTTQPVPPEEGVNKTLIITGVLHKDVKGDRFMAQILDNIGKKDWLFKFGRVKCLLWIDDDQVARYIPRTFGRRNRAAVLAQAFTDMRILAQPPMKWTWADHRFLRRIDHWNDPGHKPNDQDRVTGVAYNSELTYYSMTHEPEPLTFQQTDYWPPLPWAQTTLVEFTPKLPMHYLVGDVPDSEPWKYFNHMLTCMFMARQVTIKEALSKMGGGTEMLLETDEELKMMPDLAEKHTVHLSIPELVALAKGYEFWPWRSEDPFLGAELRLRTTGMTEEEESKWTSL
ncbi:hypothetical protein H072_7059 [Dactylellina haptotyla CBS 200.50]|uniref:rRNA adenine N(6)-methyltransferase n=1 Tax=Dactylellina haptotyla (strain CBS 200.50) TaxID=1284197 RepID=S8A8F2_DACHA|nr:hypothetical protein H072_7059 [Dactylellina haptotyla CBS 200.50]